MGIADLISMSKLLFKLNGGTPKNPILTLVQSTAEISSSFTVAFSSDYLYYFLQVDAHQVAAPTSANYWSIQQLAASGSAGITGATTRDLPNGEVSGFSHYHDKDFWAWGFKFSKVASAVNLQYSLTYLRFDFS